ncbi:MAG: hypothetical protein DRP01_07250 [Archaeoglobales archaeon]|nr:MAG: hypothetical protein DRP01_07250 [Archaeoglobales archaeon]
MKEAFSQAEERIIVYGGIYPKFWKDFEDLLREKAKEGVKIIFILDSRCKYRKDEILKELPWLRDIAELRIANTDFKKHFEIVDNGKFIRIEKPHGELKVGSLIDYQLVNS